MRKKECPSCAMQVDEQSKECPVCGYEFPQGSKTPVWVIVLLLVAVALLVILKMV